MGLSLAGGGIRAAAFSFGVMMELEQIHVCWEGFYDESDDGHPKRNIKRIHKVAYKPANVSLESMCNGFEIKNSTDDIRSLDTGNLLEMMHDISAVSGSAQVASYYMLAPKNDAWPQTFREKLSKINPTLALAGRIQLRNSFTPWLDPLLRPSLLISSFLDNISHVVNFAFSPIAKVLPIPEIPDTSPFLIFGGTQGLIKPEDLAKVYDKWYFDNERISMEDLSSVHRYTNLLINATDVRSHQIFTFDQETFSCMGLTRGEYKAFPLSLALAASSTLPVIVSPYKFNPRTIRDELRPYTDRGKKHFLAGSALMNADCHSSLTYGVHTPPVLMDGGVIDNLGLITLSQIGFWKKNHFFNKDGHPNPALKLFMISVNATVTGGSNLPVLGDDPLGKNLDQGFDVLMNDKTDVTRTIFETNLDTFGVSTLEFRFSDVLCDEHVIARILELQRLSRRKTDSLLLSQFSEEITASRHSREEVLRALNNVGMAPSQEQIDLVILAGRASVASRFENIEKALRNLDGKKFQEDCDTIMNLSKFYCWPTTFTTPGILNLDQRSVLFKLHDERKLFLEKTIANRARRMKDIKERLRERLIEQTEAGFSPSPERAPYASPIFNSMCSKDLPFSIYGQVSLAGLDRDIKELKDWCGAFTSDSVYTNYTTNALRRLETRDWEPIKTFQESMLQKCSTLANFPNHQTICKATIYNSLSWLAFQLASLQSQLGASPNTRSFVREGFHYLHFGLHNDPNNIQLNSTLGLMLFTRLGGYRTGLSHIEKAIQLIADRERDTIDALPSSHTAPTELIGNNPLLEQLEGLERLSLMLKQNYVRFFSLSPMSDGLIHPNLSGEEWLTREYGHALASQIYSPINNHSADKAEKHHDDCELLLVRKELGEGFVPNTLLLNPEFVDSCRISHAAIPDDQTIKQIQLLAQKASERQNHEAQLASKYANEVFANDTRTWNQALLYEDNATYLLMGAGWKFCQDQANNTLEAIDLLKKAKSTFLRRILDDNATENNLREIALMACQVTSDGCAFTPNTACHDDCIDQREKDLHETLTHISKILETYPYNPFSPKKAGSKNQDLYKLLQAFDRSVFANSAEGTKQKASLRRVSSLRSLLSQYESIEVKTRLAEHLECINN